MYTRIYYNLFWHSQVTPQQKGRVFSPFNPVSTSNSETKDPKSVKRKRGLVYLSRIPSPPPLTPLKTKASPCVNKTFNPPRRSVTPKPPERDAHRNEDCVPDEELVMIDTQALLDGLKEGWWEKCYPVETLIRRGRPVFEALTTMNAELSLWKHDCFLTLAWWQIQRKCIVLPQYF